MASHENTSAAIESALNAAQVLFSADPAFLTPQTKQVLEAQQRFFDELEKFTSAWFQRRQDATHSLIDIGRRIVAEGKSDPASAIKEFADWQSLSLERLTQDARECSEMLSKCIRPFSAPAAKVTQGTLDSTKKAAGASKSDPA